MESFPVTETGPYAINLVGAGKVVGKGSEEAWDESVSLTE